MRILIQALPREGFASRPRCKRFWPSDMPVAVEVVAEPAEPVQIGVTRELYLGPTVEVTYRNPHTNVEEKTLKPDPERITRKELEAIKADPFLRTMSDGETMSGLSQAALDAARKQATDLQGKLTDAEVAKAELGEKLAASQSEVADLKAEVAALKVRVAELEAKAGDETPPATDPPADKGTAGKGGKAK